MRWSTRRPARVPALLALLALTAALVGCGDSGPTSSRMALAMDGGKLTLLVVVCAGETDAQLSIDDEADPSLRNAWIIASTTAKPKATADEIVRFTAFELPPGFKQVESGLTALTEGTSYYARADTTAEFDETGIAFTPADVPSIADGVLANVEMGKDTTAVIPESQLITRYCG